MKDFLNAIKSRFSDPIGERISKVGWSGLTPEEQHLVMDPAINTVIGATTAPTVKLKPVVGNAQKMIRGINKSKLTGKFRSDPAVASLFEAIKRRLNY